MLALRFQFTYTSVAFNSYQSPKISFIMNNERATNSQHIGILNLWWTSNYGANLTALALQRFLQDLGYTSELINYTHYRDPDENYEQSVYCQFAKRELIATERYLHHEPLFELNNRFDTFIVGSDQVWRYDYMKGTNFACFFNFVAADKKLLAYAASFGVDKGNWPDNYRSTIECLLQRFDALSVREQNGVGFCKEFNAPLATWVVDPVFLFDRAWWAAIADQANEELPDHFIAHYILDMSESIKSSLQSLSADCLVDITQWEGKKSSVYQWVKAIRDCDSLITDSFHGVCFAILFRRPFAVYANKQRGYARFDSLLSAVGMLDRIITPEAGAERLHQLLSIKVDTLALEDQLDPFIVRSKEFLKKAMERECRNNRLSYTLHLALENKKRLIDIEKRFIKISILKYKFILLFSWGYKRYRTREIIKELKSRISAQ